MSPFHINISDTFSSAYLIHNLLFIIFIIPPLIATSKYTSIPPFPILIIGSVASLFSHAPLSLWPLSLHRKFFPPLGFGLPTRMYSYHSPSLSELCSGLGTLHCLAPLSGSGSGCIYTLSDAYPRRCHCPAIINVLLPCVHHRLFSCSDHIWVFRLNVSRATRKCCWKKERKIIQEGNCMNNWGFWENSHDLVQVAVCIFPMPVDVTCFNSSNAKWNFSFQKAVAMTKVVVL